MSQPRHHTSLSARVSLCKHECLYSIGVFLEGLCGAECTPCTPTIAHGHLTHPRKGESPALFIHRLPPSTVFRWHVFHSLPVSWCALVSNTNLHFPNMTLTVNAHFPVNVSTFSVAWNLNVYFHQIMLQLLRRTGLNGDF